MKGAQSGRKGGGPEGMHRRDGDKRCLGGKMKGTPRVMDEGYPEGYERYWVGG